MNFFYSRWIKSAKRTKSQGTYAVPTAFVPIRTKVLVIWKFRNNFFFVGWLTLWRIIFIFIVSLQKSVIAIINGFFVGVFCMPFSRFMFPLFFRLCTQFIFTCFFRLTQHIGYIYENQLYKNVWILYDDSNGAKRKMQAKVMRIKKKNFVLLYITSMKRIYEKRKTKRRCSSKHTKYVCYLLFVSVRFVSFLNVHRRYDINQKGFFLSSIVVVVVVAGLILVCIQL